MATEVTLDSHVWVVLIETYGDVNHSNLIGCIVEKVFKNEAAAIEHASKRNRLRSEREGSVCMEHRSQDESRFWTRLPPDVTIDMAFIWVVKRKKLQQDAE